MFEKKKKPTTAEDRKMIVSQIDKVNEGIILVFNKKTGEVSTLVKRMSPNDLLGMFAQLTQKFIEEINPKLHKELSDLAKQRTEKLEKLDYIS